MEFARQVLKIACVVCLPSPISFLRNSFRWKKCLNNLLERRNCRLMKKLRSSILSPRRRTSFFISSSLGFLLRVDPFIFFEERPTDTSNEIELILVKDPGRQTTSTMSRYLKSGRSLARRVVIFSFGLSRQPWLLCQ